MKAYFIYLRLGGLYAPIHLVCSLYTLPNYGYSLNLLIRYVVVHNLNHRFNYSQYTQLYYYYIIIYTVVDTYKYYLEIVIGLFW